MRNDRIIPGVILVLLGAMFLLHNYGLLHIHWENFAYLWPVFIIIGGVNLILAHNRSEWATVLRIAVVVLGFGLIAFGNFGNRFRFWPSDITYWHNWDKDNNDDNDDSDSSRSADVVKIEGNSTFNQPYVADAHIVKLSVSGGATVYTLNDTTNQLFSAVTKEFKGRYEFEHHKEGDSLYVLNFDMKENQHFHTHNSDKTNEAILKLNAGPIWDINLEAGATKSDLDLSKFKIRNVKIDGGAGSFDIKLGNPLTLTKIDVDAAAADVTVRIPQNAACRITKDSFLSSSTFNGFVEKNDGYETPGYDNAKNKISINIDGVASGFKVTRY